MSRTHYFCSCGCRDFQWPGPWCSGSAPGHWQASTGDHMSPSHLCRGVFIAHSPEGHCCHCNGHLKCCVMRIKCCVVPHGTKRCTIEIVSCTLQCKCRILYDLGHGPYKHVLIFDVHLTMNACCIVYKWCVCVCVCVCVVCVLCVYVHVYMCLDVLCTQTVICIYFEWQHISEKDFPSLLYTPAMIHRRVM